MVETCSIRSVGEREEDWRGRWGGEPPYRAPVFVLSHHTHEPIETEGGTTFDFVTGGFDAAYAAAAEAAGGAGVDIVGGAAVVRQALHDRVIDELALDITPVLLGSGSGCSTGWRSSGSSRRRCCAHHWPRMCGTGGRLSEQAT